MCIRDSSSSALLGKAFETLDENGIVNPDIKPETGWNYELGLIGSTNDNSLSYNLNLYYMDIKNLLVAQRTSFDTFTGVNAGRTTHPGLEATINFPLLRSQNLTITSSSNSLTLNGRNSGTLIFQTGGSERARLNSDALTLTSAKIFLAFKFEIDLFKKTEHRTKNIANFFYLMF